MFDLLFLVRSVVVQGKVHLALREGCVLRHGVEREPLRAVLYAGFGLAWHVGWLPDRREGRGGRCRRWRDRVHRGLGLGCRSCAGRRFSLGFVCVAG